MQLFSFANPIFKHVKSKGSYQFNKYAISARGKCLKIKPTAKLFSLQRKNLPKSQNPKISKEKSVLQQIQELEEQKFKISFEKSDPDQIPSLIYSSSLRFTSAGMIVKKPSPDVSHFTYYDTNI